MTSPIDPAVVTAAIHAVRSASLATRFAQGRLATGDTLTKSDDSPVTVADFAAQAIVCSSLTQALGDIALVGEENPDDLIDQPELVEGIGSLMARGLDLAKVGPSAVIDAIGLGSTVATPGGSYWTLDPIDGTKGFVRGDQYAIALALIEAGSVVLGVLGCPNMVNADGSTGAIFVAADGAARMYLGASTSAQPVRVGQPASLTEARLCESVESGHSDQDQSVQIARLLGIEADPFRIDSQCKYGAVARGDASIYLRLPTRADYVEKIWDHAAGKFVVEQAGGVVTDVTGAPLDFSRGAGLSANSGVVATSGGFHADVITAVQSVLSA